VKPNAEINLLVVHHSASALSTTAEDIRSWHVDGNGWDATGYHWVIEAEPARIIQARPFVFQGAHVKSRNLGSVGVCLVGNNTDPALVWTQDQVTLLQKLFLALRTLVPTIDVAGHRDVASGTECPGLDVRPMLLGPRYAKE
jgi:hypothetical protein